MSEAEPNPGRLHRWWAYSWLVAEALIVLTAAQIMLKLVPSRRYSIWLERLQRERQAPAWLARRMRRTIDFAGRLLPWKPLCFPRAVAGKAMLARRGYGSVLTFGVAVGDDQMLAHAWLKANGVIIAGREGLDRYSPVANV